MIERSAKAADNKLDYDAEITVLLHGGFLNTFMASYLKGLRREGLNEAFWQEALDDAQVATEVGVDSESDFRTFFYIDHFVEDLVKEIFGTKMDDKEEDELKKFMFKMRDRVKYSDLLSFRVAVLEWLRSRGDLKKGAFPNRGIPYWAEPKYDLGKWAMLARKIIDSVALGFSRDFALRDVASTLKVPEKYDFLAWYRQQTEGLSSKYNVNRQIRDKNRELGLFRSRAEQEGRMEKKAVSSDERFYYVPTFRAPADVAGEKEAFRSPKTEQDAMDFEALRKKMMGRVFSLDKLIERYRRVLSDEQLGGIEGTLNDLKGKIRRLKLAASVKDSMLKTAGILRGKWGFGAGADLLTVIAADPTLAPAAPSPGPLKDTEVPEIPKPEIADPEDPGAKKQRESLRKIVEQLAMIQYTVKSRNIIRELAKVDMQLDDIGMATYFTEISESIAKLIDSFGYVGNRLEDLMPKLQGGLIAGQLQEKEEKPSLKTDVKELAKNVKREPKDTEPELSTPKPAAPKAPEASATPPVEEPPLRPLEVPLRR